MRIHIHAAAGLSALLLALAGCSGGDSGDAGDSGATAAAPVATAPAGASAASAAASAPAAGESTGKGGTPAKGDAALSADSEAICEQASRTSTAFGQTFAEDYRLLTEAAGQGGQAKTNAEQKAARDVQNFSFALHDMAKLAADAKLKDALAAMGDQVTALKGDLEKLDDKKLAALHATLDKACGRG
ncbi:hypothetical protein [Actinoplanes sp. DH11]|uniref:hypothetical protein n=1 Tax=Actinoplanes sp. DH11 TaxID=2857011 RepID=UPI001E4B83DE|nr:hypothetical protein [Actinoplanes sp. DH11]